MAMNCCHKEYAEVCEIRVCVDTPASFNPGLYQRLRFGLLASSWFPIPLGIFLWSALHAILLIVCGPVLWVYGLLTHFLSMSVFTFGWLGILFCSVYVVFGLFAVAADLVGLLVESIRFCWSLVSFLACHEPIVEWRGGACWTILVWKRFKTGMRAIFWAFVPIGVPCMSGSLYRATKDRYMKTWARWCEQVVHVHEAIAL